MAAVNLGLEAYEQAKKSGEKYIKEAQSKEKNPYPLVLDEILKNEPTAGEVRLPLKEISLNDIAGTKTQARSHSFAGNFMPILDVETEFASKWISLYNSQMDEGLRDPIKVYEFKHQYYVQEGNKRVSVMKYLQPPSIMAQIIRILPEKSEKPSVKAYYEYLDFIKDTGMDFLHFSQPGMYSKFRQYINVKDNEENSEEIYGKIRSSYKRFLAVYEKMGGLKLHLHPSEAFYLYIKLYGYEGFEDKSEKQVEKELSKIWNDFTVFPNRPEVELVTDTKEEGRKSLLSMRIEPLKVAFINSRTPSTSSWTKTHSKAMEYLQKMFPYEIKTQAYFNADSAEEEAKIIEQAIQDGNEVIFTTSPAMLRSSLQMAAKYPKIKILNCSLNTSTGHLRTYFARTYEIYFLFGMIAGILSHTNRIGFIADYPIYGMIANINAFALGASMTNPQAKIYLDWSTTKESMLQQMEKDIDITFISGQEFDSQIYSTNEYGLYDYTSGKFLNLSQIVYYWGEFYVKMVREILNQGWISHLNNVNESVNYWWGLSNRMLDMQFSDKMPHQTKRLIEVMKEHMSEGHFNPFSTQMKDQNGNIKNEDDHTMDPEDIVKMDWLMDNIIGTIPQYEDFMDDSKRIISLHGIYQIPKKKEEDAS